MALQFDPETHTYTLDGERLPSVTEIIRFTQYDTAKAADPHLKQAAADRGSRIHAYTVLMDYEDLPDEVDRDCFGYLKAYKDFLRDTNPQWSHIEYMLGNKTLGFAGTIDRVGNLFGNTAIVDIKTGTRVNKTYFDAQLTGYSLLLGLPWVPDVYDLILSKDGTYRLLKGTVDYSLFAACKELYNATERRKRRNGK